jgi:hypothetical protein
MALPGFKDREPFFTTLRGVVPFLRKVAAIRHPEVFEEPALRRLKLSDEY